MTQVSLTSDFVEVVKLPIPVTVEFALNDGIIETLEGPVHYIRGDAIITGINGERWPVQRLKHFANYAPVPPTQTGQNGFYLKRATKTIAKKMMQPFTVSVGYAKDPLKGRVGDWLLQYADGSHGVVAADIFSQTYQVILRDGSTQSN